MSNSDLKTGITKMLKQLNDERFLRTIYAMVSEYTGIDDYSISDDQKKMLESRRKAHKAGKSKSYSVKQMKEMVLKNLR
jgi:hypothetical protein